MDDISDLVKITSVLGTVTLGYLIYENNSIEIREFDLFTKKTPHYFKGFKILHLNNLYGKNFGEANSKLLNKIHELKPDIIVTTGNMLKSNLDRGWTFLELCKNLRRFYPIYYLVEESIVNEEKKTKEYLLYLKELSKNGVILINDGKVALIKREDKINIYGIFIRSDEIKDYKFDKKDGKINFLKENIENKIGLPNKSEFNIVLTNEVLNFDSYVKWGSDITFSGYNRRINKYIFNNLNDNKKGIFIKRDSSMILSRGLGNKFLRARLFYRPEITLITLR
ncbi:hypothetical protein [Clostridium sp.]|uniref:metallophosphoesterase n=1 Tax=Clostridium sp. TaxID=1506 RepID=UPI0026361067|nr:hypothetical protein [Clostridium sp.]